MKLLITILYVALFAGICPAQSVIDLKNWKFQTGDNPEWANPGFDDSGWPTIKSGSDWESQGFLNYDGYAWYRVSFNLPSIIKNDAISDTLLFLLGRIDDCDQTYLNGRLLGVNARLISAGSSVSSPDLSKTETVWDIPRCYKIPVSDTRLLWDHENFLAVRVYDRKGGGGMKTSPVEVRMQGFADNLAFDVDTKMLVTNWDGTVSKTIILRNNTKLSALEGRLNIEISYYGEKHPVATQTFDVNMKGKTGEFTLNFTGHHLGLMVARCKFVEAKTGKTVEQTLEFINRWTEKQANDWYKRTGWMCGCNFIPSTAINQLEMWQADTFDPVTIDRELGWAESLGFNLVRVFLHHKAWLQDPTGFKNRMEKYLSIADKHHIKTMFVIFDDCWNETSHMGKQPVPSPGIHNSGWIQDPGPNIKADTLYYPVLECYVKDILNHFANDERVAIWDVYNEPSQINTLRLLKYSFSWARETKADQPIMSCIFGGNDIKTFLSKAVDLISFHNYDSVQSMKANINRLRLFNRPIICTEYMARAQNSTFQTILPVLKKENVSAVNWGLVAGKTNTIYPWFDRSHSDGSEPKLWFHDIFRKDGTPYSQEEIDCIRNECLKQ